MTNLAIEHNLNSGILEIALSGSLNETADFSNLPIDGSKEIYIDFNQLEFINSTGINKWIQWMSKLENDHASTILNFCNCPKIIVDQINAVKGFLPKTAHVESFWIPFYCEESDRREFLLLTRGKEFMEESSSGQDWVNIPDCQCSETQTPCEPDVMPKKYFSFLKARKN